MHYAVMYDQLLSCWTATLAYLHKFAYSDRTNSFPILRIRSTRTRFYDDVRTVRM